MTAEPRTPEGRIIRRARKRARLAIPEAARQAGMSEAWWGELERGYSREDKNRTINPLPDVLARMVSVLSLTEAEHAEILGICPPAADALAGILAQSAAAGPDVAALLDRLVEAIIRDRDHRNFHDRETLEFLWRGIRNGKPKPLEERIQGVIDWIEDQPRREAKEIRSAG